MTLYDQLQNDSLLLSSWGLIYRKKSKDKRRRGKDIKGLSLSDYKKNHLERISLLAYKLKTNTYVSGELKGFLKEKTIKKTKRLIGIAEVDDRIVQKSILTLINPSIIPLLINGVSFGAISRGKIRDDDEEEAHGIHGAIVHLEDAVKNKNFWVFKSDIESFYDKIPKKKLYEKILKLLPDASLGLLLKEIIYAKWGNEDIFTEYPMPNNKIGIAQGPPLSPMMSNIFLIDFDCSMKKIYGKRYIRYADDFVVITKSEKEALIAKKNAINFLRIEDLDLSKNPQKTTVTNIAVNPIIFLGLKITSAKITAKDEKQILAKVQTYLDEKGNVKSKILKVNNYTRGILESYKRYHSDSLFKKINQKISHKRRLNKYGALKLLIIDKKLQVVSEQEWVAYFKN